MSSNSTIVVCPDNDDQGTELVDRIGIVIAILSVIGGIITYFVQQHQERRGAAEAKAKEDADTDRMLALERARLQLSDFVGPLHRLLKTLILINSQYCLHTGHGLDHFGEAFTNKGRASWFSFFKESFVSPFAEDPRSREAVVYRNLVARRLKPIYTRIRELWFAHGSDLADMPSQEEWLEQYNPEDITSPYSGSMNINVIFDTFAAWTLEFDDIIESWANEDFHRMQPTIHVAFLICNSLIDTLYDNAKAKEAKYNKHVTVNKNTIQSGTGTINDMVQKMMVFSSAKDKTETEKITA